MRVVALVPAHNEQDSIAEALDSLSTQTRRPDQVVVIADNCTDATVSVVRSRGDATVYPTVDNRAKKAGALNQVLETLLPTLADDDAVLVMDADSALDPHFVAAAAARLGARAERGKHSQPIGGVGGTFTGARGGGFVGMLQRNEYARYARDVRRLKGKVLVLTGTAAMFQVSALRAVIEARTDGRLPGAPGQVYDTRVLTEDNELTLALMHLGYRILSPRECGLVTEVMTTWGDLWRQRLRWKRGALENLRDYGWTRITRRYWGRQVVTYLGVLVTAVYLATLGYSLGVNHTLHLHPVWLAITVLFAVERVVTVRSRGPLQMALASVLVVEMCFDFFLQAAQGKALWDSLRNSERNW